MKIFHRSILISVIVLLMIATATARTWRDPVYGGVYEFEEDGTLTVVHPTREFNGKWTSTSPSSVEFQLYDKNGRLRGVNSLEMRTETTAVVRLDNISRTFHWNLVESRGPSETVDSTEGWFMEPLRF